MNKKGKTEFLAKFLNLKKICKEENQNSLLRCFINEEYDPLVTFLKFIEDYYVPSDIDGKKKFAIYDKGMNNLIGEGINMFCCNKMDSLEGRSILESLMYQNAGTRRQREQLLHLLIKIRSDGMYSVYSREIQLGSIGSSLHGNVELHQKHRDGYWNVFVGHWDRLPIFSPHVPSGRSEQ